MSIEKISNILPDNTAEIFLFDKIGGDGIQGSLIADEIRLLNENGVSEIRMRINSPGGSVMDGLSIISAIRASSTPVDTYVDGIAGSIAGVISQFGRKRYMSDFGRIMIHAPSYPQGVTNVNSAEREALAQIQDILATIFERNSDKSKKEMLNIMDGEVWFNSDEAMISGFVDEVINTDRNPLLVTENNLTEIYNTYKEVLNNKQLTMKDVKNYLKLEEAANEEQVLQAVKNQVEELETKVKETEDTILEKDIVLEDSNKEVEALKKENKELKDQIEEVNKKEVLEYVENSISEGKYKSDQKENLLESASNNFESFKSITNSIVVTAPDVISSITNSGEAPTESLRELEKNNPSKVESIRNNSPELYAQMYKAEYGTELK